MRRRSIITVQPMGDCAPWKPAERAIIRLRGKWIAHYFPPYTQLVATLEERRGTIAIVLEPVYWEQGEPALKSD